LDTIESQFVNRRNAALQPGTLQAVELTASQSGAHTVVERLCGDGEPFLVRICRPHLGGKAGDMRVVD
jgi:hypothetical protein